LVREPSRPAAPSPGRTAVLDAFRLELRRHRAFAWLVVSRFLFLLATYAVGRFFLLFVAARLALDPSRAAHGAGTPLEGRARGARRFGGRGRGVRRGWGCRAECYLSGPSTCRCGWLMCILRSGRVSSGSRPPGPARAGTTRATSCCPRATSPRSSPSAAT